MLTLLLKKATLWMQMPRKNTIFGKRNNEKFIYLQTMKKLGNTTEMHSAFVGDVCAIVEEGRRKAYGAVNSAMIETYWKVGQRIVE